MQDRRYLLDLRQMLDENSSEALLQEALHRVDGERRQKALRIKSAKARAASVGAGLLLQKTLADYAEGQMSVITEKSERTDLSEQTGQMGRSGQSKQTGRMERTREAEQTGRIEQTSQLEQIRLECFSVEELLAVMDSAVVEPAYRYGGSGKPYLADYSFQFNLSHSDAYVFCGVSEQEIGVDIQRIQSGEKLHLAKRFFSAGECQILEDCEDEETRNQMFFRMWTRKEAYGKLTGKGLADALGKDLWTEGAVEGIVLPDASRENIFQCSYQKGLVWEEYDVPTGYRIAVCKHSI